MTIIVVDDAKCAVINESSLAHSGPTDVITFSYPSFPGEPSGETVEIVINAQCALKQGGSDVGREFAFYLAHAFDHIAGYNDDTPKARTAMHRREWRWIKQANPTDLIVTAPKSHTGPDLSK